MNTFNKAYQISSNRRALALCGIGFYPATLETTLCRWFQLTHWRLWTFLGS